MPMYTYRCDRCAHEVTLTRVIADRDKPYKVCDRQVPVAGAAVEGFINPDGSLDITGVSLVELGKQADPHAVLNGPCGGTYVRDGIELNAKMRHQWMP